MWKLIRRKNKEKSVKKTKKSRNSCIEMEISGYNIERTLNFLCSKNVEFYEVEKYNLKQARIQIKPKDKKFVKQFLAERKIEVESEKYVGLFKLSNFFKVRYGILIGLFLAISLVIVMSNFMLKIDVIGAENVDAAEIVTMLEENGVSPFTHLNSIQTEQVEKLVLQHFDKVSSVSAIKKGCTIVINIKEKVINDEFEDLENISPLLATQNGMITDITLIQGTLLVKVGDIVKVGDPLVAPYTFDSNGKQIPIVPKAKIMADVWLTGKEEHTESYIKKERTGDFVSFRQTTLFGSPIFSNLSECPFENYDIEEKICYLTDYVIPIKYKEIFYFETKCVIIEKKFEDVKDELFAQAKKNALMQVGGDVDIKNEDCTYAQNGDKWIVTYTVTINKNIAI